jgi:hypothetical protein
VTGWLDSGPLSGAKSECRRTRLRRLSSLVSSPLFATVVVPSLPPRGQQVDSAEYRSSRIEYHPFAVTINLGLACPRHRPFVGVSAYVATAQLIGTIIFDTSRDYHGAGATVCLPPTIIGRLAHCHRIASTPDQREWHSPKCVAVRAGAAARHRVRKNFARSGEASLISELDRRSDGCK